MSGTHAVRFRGQEVILRGEAFHPTLEPCDHAEVDVMHHYGPEGEHYCPTGFVMCLGCGRVGYEPDPPECTLWATR